MIVMVDGSVHYMRSSTPPRVVAALISANGREVVDVAELR
jgi:hypothetical protein